MIRAKRFTALAAVTLISYVVAVDTGSPASAAAPAPACAAPVASTTQPGYLVADPDCDSDGTPFTALTDAAGAPLSDVHTGVADGAAYRIEVPREWNGDLVVYAHGYRGTGTTVSVNNPALREYYVQRGFAWAASSYQTNGYDIGQAVRDSHALLDIFRQATGLRFRSAYLTGASMGGGVTVVGVEAYPGEFVGAMPYCGALGDADLFDYFLDANVAAAALSGVAVEFPRTPAPDFPDRWRAEVARMLPALGIRTGAPPVLTDAGRALSAVVARRTGGVRPGFDGAFAFWNALPSPLGDVPFLFGQYPGLNGGTVDIAAGNVTDNRFTVYRSTDRLLATPAELRLNATVLRVRPTARPTGDLTGLPRVVGEPSVPVLSLHDIGDLFVPFSMEQVYARRAALHGQSRWFVSRAIRGVGHCDFTQPELRRGFDDLVAWVRTGVRPAGDSILDRRKVADPAFGCRFTVGPRPAFQAPPCPQS